MTLLGDVMTDRLTDTSTRQVEIVFFGDVDDPFNLAAQNPQGHKPMESLTVLDPATEARVKSAGGTGPYIAWLKSLLVPHPEEVS